jgi:hypothetical protein
MNPGMIGRIECLLSNRALGSLFGRTRERDELGFECNPEPIQYAIWTMVGCYRKTNQTKPAAGHLTGRMVIYFGNYLLPPAVET